MLLVLSLLLLQRLVLVLVNLVLCEGEPGLMELLLWLLPVGPLLLVLKMELELPLRGSAAG